MSKLGKTLVDVAAAICLATIIFCVTNYATQLMAEPLRDALLVIIHQKDDIPCLTRVVYDNGSAVLGTVIAVVLVWAVVRNRRGIVFKCYAKRDFLYLQDIIKSNNSRSPASSLDDLVVKIAGVVDEKTKAMVIKEISASLNKVVSLLSSSLDKYKIGIIEGDWGVGKTTMTMLALEEIENTSGSDRRYIYEIAFLYVGNIAKFRSTILKALKDTLSEQGVRTGLDVDKIILNLQKDYIKSLSAFLRASRNVDLTSELIKTLNERYSKKNKRFEIDVIIDDIDRLPARDMLEMVAFLAALNQLKFVRIILPIEIDAVEAQIKRKIKYHPEMFLDKYLPEQASVEIKSKYSIAEGVALEKIRAWQASAKTTDYYPVWAAVLFKLISEKVDIRAKDWSDNFRWDANYAGQQPQEYKDKLTKSLRQRYWIENKNLSTAPLYLHNISDGRKFESYITVTTLQDGTTKIKDVFSEEYYEKCAKWVLAFANNCWGLLGISMREIIDTLALLEGTEFSQGDDSAALFAKAFNRLFGGEIIHLA